MVSLKPSLNLINTTFCVSIAVDTQCLQVCVLDKVMGWKQSPPQKKRKEKESNIRPGVDYTL